MAVNEVEVMFIIPYGCSHVDHIITPPPPSFLKYRVAVSSCSFRFDGR